MHRIQYIFVNRWLSSWFFYLTGCYFPSGESLLWWLLLTSQMSKYWSAWEVSGDRQNLFPIWAQISVISPRALPYIYINIGSSWICHPTKFLQKLQAHRYICLLSGWASILVTPQLGTSPPRELLIHYLAKDILLLQGASPLQERTIQSFAWMKNLGTILFYPTSKSVSNLRSSYHFFCQVYPNHHHLSSPEPSQQPPKASSISAP